MTAAVRHMSAEELWTLPADDLRRELVRGELHTMAPAGFHHGSVVATITSLLVLHVKRNQLGVVVGAETGFVLTRNPDTVRGVDVGFVQAGRLPAGERPYKFWEGAPDLAVEVLSPSDTVEAVENKVDDYLAAGTSMVWLVNPNRRTVTVYRPGQQPLLLRETDMLEGGEVVRGFVCRVGEIFA